MDPLSHAERTPVVIHDHSSRISACVAAEIADLIRQRAAEDRMCVLGLATGSTPTGVYEALVRMHRHDALCFRNVVTFNLDEYFPMQPNELQSYHRFMHEYLFDHVDIDPRNIHIPDGTLSAEEVPNFCRAYELMIEQAGGIDLQLLGIGRTGHIGFNEPGSARTSRTRMIWLDRLTRRDAASDFFGAANVPSRAITMGVGTILDAKRIILLAFGEGKASIIRRAVEGEVSPLVAASFLQEHPNAQVYLDHAAAAGLTRIDTPWLLDTHVDWDAGLIRRAAIWLARQTGKALLKLTDEDYNEHHLQGLLADHGPAYNINLNVFRAMQRTITGWPGGKPPTAGGAPDEVFPKRVIVFSPHPDDDVISMGGTLIRLAEHGHDVHVAYQTSGNIAVFDDDALTFIDFVSKFNAMFGIDKEHETAQMAEEIGQFLTGKLPGQVDSQRVQTIKTLIRRGEARAAGRYCGLKLGNLHFLDMPFYETGKVRKKPLGEQDIRILIDLLNEVKPHQVYAAGDLSDPHGTHRVCLNAIFEALGRVADQPWAKDCQLWLYRGAWQEWEPHDIDMAVPLSPQELLRKRQAIFKHESQKDKALFPGVDDREFWQRAEDRNTATAKLYNVLGLAEYEAIEAFRLWSADCSKLPITAQGERSSSHPRAAAPA